MMTDIPLIQSMNTNGQTLVTPAERQALIQKLSEKWSPELSARVENLSYEKSRGLKSVYLRCIQHYHNQVQAACQQRAQQQQQQQQSTMQLLNYNNNTNTGQFINQQIDPSQQSSIAIHSVPSHQLNPMLNQQQTRFSSMQQPLQPRMPNPQPTIPNQLTRLREPQNFISSSNSSVSTIDLPPTYPSQSQTQISNGNINDYLTQNRYPSQPSINPRPRPTTNLNMNFPQQPSTNNSNDILHQFVVGNPPANPMTSSVTNTSAPGDRLLQQILLSNNDGASNKTSIQNRQTTPSLLSQQTRPAIPTNNNLNSLRTPQQQPSPSSSVIIMPTPNVQIQPSTNVTIQQSPLSNSSGPYSSNPQILSQSMNSSTPLNTNYSSPINRSLPSTGSGSILSPDEDTINLLKYFKENVGKLQSFCQKFASEGHTEKARNAQVLHQQMVQFINNPTYESLSNAKHIREILERASSRPQPLSSSSSSTATTSTTTSTNPPTSQINDINQFEKCLNEYFSRDQKKRIFLHQIFIEPLCDVINGVPHKKIRLDSENTSNSLTLQKVSSLNHSSSFLTQLNDEINSLPDDIYSIERLPLSHSMKNIQLNDEYFSKNGIILRCKLLDLSNPLIPPLRLKISTRYPENPPEILSLTNTTPPKLEFTDGHPFFEQISNLFVSYLFKLPTQHTITDILHIWRQSVQNAL